MGADELNTNVTKAILDAEAHDYEGAKLWDTVAAAEKAIAESKDPAITLEEHVIAQRGYVQATARARLLRRE